MKKIIILLILMLFALPSYSMALGNSSESLESTSVPLECGVSFDWISKTQLQRDENISQIQNTLFAEETAVKYSKKEFKEKYSGFWKDKESRNHYIDISSGKKEDADKKYCGFFWKNNLLIAYGIQYKNNLKNIYYYDALGNLRWVDIFSKNYPNFPYTSYQYDSSGKLVAAYYYVSAFEQYVFDPNQKFQGRWYKEKMYNKNAKVIMTRSNW